MIGLGNRAMQMPSVLFRTDAGFVVGEAAERRGAAEPGRLVREFKRRLGDPVPMLVGGAPYSAEEPDGRLLRGWSTRSAEQRGERPPGLVLTHPANWGPYKLELLDQVAARVVGGSTRWCAEPEAAAAQYAARARVEAGERIAVYDLGGGTFDACVLGKTGTASRCSGRPRGSSTWAASDFDEALFRLVLDGAGRRAGRRLDLDDEAVTRRPGPLRRDCVEAKEALSSDTDASSRWRCPASSTSVRVTRAELEALIRPALEETVAALAGGPASGLTRRRAGRRSCWSAAAGGSRWSGSCCSGDFHLPTALDTHPKHDIALGALRVGDRMVSSRTRRLAADVVRLLRPRHPGREADARTTAGRAGARVVPPAPARAGGRPRVRANRSGTAPDRRPGRHRLAADQCRGPSRGRRRGPRRPGPASAAAADRGGCRSGGGRHGRRVALNSAGGPGTAGPSLAPVPTSSVPRPCPTTRPRRPRPPRPPPRPCRARRRSRPTRLIVSMQTSSNWDLWLAATDTAHPLRRLACGPAADSARCSPRTRNR